MDKKYSLIDCSNWSPWTNPKSRFNDALKGLVTKKFKCKTWTKPILNRQEYQRKEGW